jgi:hypothetical protein
MYERETSWAPPYVAEELRLARMQARSGWENTVRAEHEARAAADPGTVVRHQVAASMWRAMETKATRIADELAAVQETRRQWDALTEPSRRVAVAADIELRRRHPGMQLEPLKSAEQEGIVLHKQDQRPSREIWIQETLDGPKRPAPEEADRPGVEGRPLTAEQRAFAGQEALGLTPDAVHEEIPDQVRRIQENVRLAQAKIDELQNARVPSEDHEGADLGRAWDVLGRRQRDAIVQPPKPDIVPARGIMKREQERVAEHEAEPA